MRIPVTNNGTTNLHVGGAVIPPNDTRMVEEHLVPPKLRRAAAPAADTGEKSPLEQLMAGKVADIIAALPELGDEDLDALAAVEQAKSKPRASLVEAIAAEKLARHQDGGDDGDQEPQA